MLFKPSLPLTTAYTAAVATSTPSSWSGPRTLLPEQQTALLQVQMDLQKQMDSCLLRLQGWDGACLEIWGRALLAEGTARTKVARQEQALPVSNLQTARWETSYGA